MAFGRKSGFESQPSTGGGADLGALTAFIDQGSSFEGKLSFKDTVRIDGHFSGQISSENTLVVGETGVIEANVRSQVVIISGAVAGDIVAASRVVVHKTGRVDGNVETPSLVMEDGAVIIGQLKMGTAKKSTPVVTPPPSVPKPQI
ncbi:MAG TPA: polymer-forming cytoskeletal protein [Myxococcota bacterium]|nr:polymer-forming cytoskeletal protein [Myxococcota bacterium]